MFAKMNYHRMKIEGYSSRSYSDRGRKRFFLVLFFFVSIGWMYVLTSSDLFVIRRIEILGGGEYDKEDISAAVFRFLDQERKWSFFPVRHSWKFDSKRLGKFLEEELFLQRAVVDKKWFHILRLSIEERNRRFILRSRQQLFFVDLYGKIFSSLNQNDRVTVFNRLHSATPTGYALALLIVHRELDGEKNVGDIVCDESEARTYLNIFQKVEQRHIPVRELEIASASSTTGYLKTLPGHFIALDLSSDLSTQLDAYQKFMESKKLDPKEYVDVRVFGRVYAK